MFRTSVFLFAFFSLCFGQDLTLPTINGYDAPVEGNCLDENGVEPNYLELWFQEHPHNCTTICDDLSTCSGISYTPSRFKLQCRIYVFYNIQQELEDDFTVYLDQEYFWIPTGDDGSRHVVSVGGNGGRYCYIRQTESPSASPSNSPSTAPSGGPTITPSVSPSFSPSVDPSHSPSDLPSVMPTNGPTTTPSDPPSVSPTEGPTSDAPSISPSFSPTSDSPSCSPTVSPSVDPSFSPSSDPTTDQPTVAPTKNPTFEEPSISPTSNPTTDEPTAAPSFLPTVSPSFDPSTSPSGVPTTDQPTAMPSFDPTTDSPSNIPTASPLDPSTSPTTGYPSKTPTDLPSVVPTLSPSYVPSSSPETSDPSVTPSTSPSNSPTTPGPSKSPTVEPSNFPSVVPTKFPTGPPSPLPTAYPSTKPSINPTGPPTDIPSGSPSFGPSVVPTDDPSTSPTVVPSDAPTVVPSVGPTNAPSSDQPTQSPTGFPTTDEPSQSPSVDPSTSPSVVPTVMPSDGPSVVPSNAPSVVPSVSPTNVPTDVPTTDTPSTSPSDTPTASPETAIPSTSPTNEEPSVSPSFAPSVSPTKVPTTDTPTVGPSTGPSSSPTSNSPSATPTVSPSSSPTTDQPSGSPSVAPSGGPTVMPSDLPSVDPTTSPSFDPSVLPTNSPSHTPTTTPSNLPTVMPSITSPCSIGKLNVLGSHFIYIDEDESFVDEDDLVFLALGIPTRYRIDKVWPSDADTENGYYPSEFWTLSEDEKQECTQRITGGFPWERIRTRELMGLTTVTDPSYYEEVDDGTYFHNILTLELSENYTSPDGWAKPGEEEYIERKVIYEIPWLILLQTEISLNVSFSVVIPTPGPSTSPSVAPSTGPTVDPSVSPSVDPTRAPSSEDPTVSPSTNPSTSPSTSPSNNPSTSPSVVPTNCPSVDPSINPSFSPSVNPTTFPSYSPSVVPTSRPSGSPTPREYFYLNLTLRSDDIWLIGDYVTQYPTFEPTQRFEVIDDVPHGGFTFFGNPAHQADITPDDLGNFQWTGANVTSDTFMTWMAESDNIRVRFDILLMAPEDCIASFTEWSSCSVTCGDGIETRTWVVTDANDAAGSCEYWDGFVDTRDCYIEICPLIDEIVTRFAVYNPDLDENSTVCMNFTTITNLPWKTIEDGFQILDPNNILNEDSATFSFNPVEGCWPSYDYNEFDGLCGELLLSGTVRHPTGMFIQIDNFEDPICNEVCDYFADDCIGYDILPPLGAQPMICEVLGTALTSAHAAEANQFIEDSRTFDWYEDEATQITGGYTFANRGAKCYKKTDPIYTGNCLQDFNMCFTMDFVCNLDELFYLELQAENLISGTEITRQFETRIATDASCAQIIGDVKLSGSLEAFYSEDRTQSVIQFYKGDTIYFTVNIDSYANVDSIGLVDMRYAQDASEGAETFSYPSSHASAIVTDTSEVIPATQTFGTEGRFSMLVTDPISGSVDGVYTKFIATFGVNFVDGRRQLLEGSYTRNIRAEMNTLIYPPKCRSPDAEPGETLHQVCDEGKRILWCDENGQWTMLVDECGADVPVDFSQGSTESPAVTRIVQSETEDTFIWRTSALAIAVSLCCACCVYYFLVCRRKKEKDKIDFFDDPNKNLQAGYIQEIVEDDESSELGTEYGTPVVPDFVTKRTPTGPLVTPPYSNAEIENDSDSSELGTYLHTYHGEDINSDIDQDMQAANQAFSELGLHEIAHAREATPATPV